MSPDDRARHFKELCDRINAVIADKWAETLADDVNTFSWARENLAELMVKHDAQEKEVNSLWLNLAEMKDFKEACTAWGRTVLEIYRLFAVELRRREAA